MSFRKETKFRLSYSDMAIIQGQLLGLGMEEIYPCRIINSCYFDNEQLSIFHDSEQGVLPRKKIRLRWYNKILDFKKEIKISSLEGRFKSIENKPNLHYLNDVLNEQYFDNSYGVLNPTLIVSYERHYFNLKSLRITFDRNITYKLLKHNVEIIATDNETVMEVKTPADCSDDYIESIIPITKSRFSKYSRGLLCFDVV